MEETFDNLDFFRMSLYVVVFIVALWIGNRFYPDVRWFFPPSVVLAFVLIFGSNFGKYILWKARYRCYQVCVNGCHGSIYGKPEFIPDSTMGEGFMWAVFNLGHSTFPVSLRGKLATLIVPADQLYSAGKSFIGLTLVQKWALNILPPDVSTFLRRNEEDFNLDNIYFGKYSQTFIDNSGKEMSLNSQINAKNSEIDILRKCMENKFGDFEEIKEFADRMNSNKGVIPKLINKVKGVGDEDV